MIEARTALPSLRHSVAIVPIEKLKLPAHLDGSTSPRGGTGCESRIDAGTDQEAIGIWLAEVPESESSVRSYRLEAERCLLWSTTERGKPLSSLDYDDVAAYAQFLIAPEPRERWVGAGSYRRDEVCWRPFRGALSPQSRDRAMRILASLFSWLATVGYIPANPWLAPVSYNRRDKENTAPALVREARANVVTAVEWAYIDHAMDRLDANDDHVATTRVRVLLYLAYFADMKTGEICALRISSVSELLSFPSPVWKLEVKGRAPEVREIILLPPAQGALGRYLEERGISLKTSMKSDSPLITSFRALSDQREWEMPFSDHGVRRVARDIFLKAAALAEAAGDRTAARRLSVATVHWLKHAFESHALQRRVRQEWCWHLLGACWLAPFVTRAYLPGRNPTADTALKAFEDLRGMWQQPEVSG